MVPSKEMLDLEKERPRLIRMAKSFLHNISEAEEIADIAITKALMHRDRIMPKNEAAWLRGIVRNECLHRIRDVKIEEAKRWAGGRGKTTLEIVIERELQEAVDQAVLDLTPAQWWALYHFQFQELSADEAGDKMARRSGSVRALVHRVRRKLARRLQEFAL